MSAAQAATSPRKNPIDNIPPSRRNVYGRPKGATDVKKKVLQDCLMMAGEIAGDRIEKGTGLVGYLVHLAMNKPDLYVSMLAKVIPLQIQGAASDGALEIRWLPPEEPPKAIIDHDAEDV
jgi:hypothetical protein